MTEVFFCYITCPNPDWAKKLGTEAVESGLAACANILPEIKSIYRWDGKLQNDSESLLILKTSSKAYESLAEYIKAQHPYENPCLIALKTDKGLPDYLQWIETQSKGLK